MKKKYQQIENFLEYSLQLLHTLEKKQPFGKKYTREEELELFKNNIRERFYFIYNVKKIQQTEEGIINISQDAVSRWKLPHQTCLITLRTEWKCLQVALNTLAT